jgi:hypothetical protein
MRWSTVKEIWRFPDFWLLLFSKAQFATIPAQCVPMAMQDFVLRHKADLDPLPNG